MDQLVDRRVLGSEIRDWVGSLSEAGQLARIVIRHEGGSQPVKVYSGPQLPAAKDDEEITSFVERIAKKMEADAAGLGGSLQVYYVEAYYGADEVYTARQPFSIQVGSERRRHGLTESADDRGALALVMRLADNGHGRSLAAYEKVIALQQVLINRLDVRLDSREAKIDALVLERGDMLSAFEELASLKQEREQSAALHAQKSKTMGELAQDLRYVAPILANRMLGEKLIPEGQLAPEQMILRRAVAEMDKPEVEILIAALAQKNPRIGLAVAELIMGVQGEGERRAAVIEAAKQGADAARKKLAEVTRETPVERQIAEQVIGEAARR